MPRRIEEDHKDFIDVVSGRLRKALKKFIKSGKFVRNRGKKGKISLSIPKIDIPHIVYGENEDGIGRGKGKPGDIVGNDPQPGQGAGDGANEGIMISLDMEDVLQFMQDELSLPNMKPKENQTFEDVKIKYNNISLIGPESLRHNRRTFLQAIKRQAAMGTLDKLHYLPGCKDPVRIVEPWASDKRYRQYNEIRIPSSNALIVYARDGSGSMDTEKCEIVSDMAWWIDVWIRRFYKRVERVHVWHDTEAIEVDEEKFYKYRFGGGTICSSALKFISSQFENRFPPEKWNIYVFYFTDGDTFGDDNQVFVNTLKEKFGENVVNFVGLVQVLAGRYENSIKYFVDEAVKDGVLDKEVVRTVEVGPTSRGSWSEEERNEQIIKAIKQLLSNKKDKGD